MDFRLKHVSREWSRTKWRYRFQRGGVKTALPGEPGEPDFMREYARLLGGPIPAHEGPLSGSIAWLVGRYLADVEIRVTAGLASPLTLKGHRHHLGRLVDAHGAKTAELPRARLVQFLDGYAATPGGRDNMRKSISAMYQWAIERELVDCENPAKTIKRINTKSPGFYTCTIDDVRKYLHHHKPGTMARRCMILCLSTTARREDLRLLGPANEIARDGVTWLRWVQSKEPHDVSEIPMLSMLQDEVEGCTAGTYLHNAKGQPYTHGMIGNHVQDWFKAAGAKGSLHGIRKGVPAILTAMGATSYELDVLLGHRTGSKETQVYVAAAKRAEIAAQMSVRMERVKW